MEGTKSLFEQAAKTVSAQKKFVDQLSNDVRANIYGLFKQAKEGDNKKDKPSMLKLEESAKLKAWTEQKGKPSEQAMKEYVELARKVLPPEAAKLIV